MRNIILLMMMAMVMMVTSGCVTNMIKAPEAEIRALDADDARTWADENKSEPNARLFVVHSKDLKSFVRFLVGIGVDVDVVKDGDGK